MFIKQISVFVENKPGRLAEITRLLGENKVDIRALSISDTTDFGIFRLIVSNPDTAIAAFQKAGLTVSLTEVVVIAVDDTPGGLAKAMDILYQSSISVEYMYAFTSRKADKGFVVLRVDLLEEAAAALQNGGIELLDAHDVYQLLV